MNLVFLDTETTSLDPRTGQIWEMAYAVNAGPIYSGFVPHDLENADPESLRIGRYYERFGHDGYIRSLLPVGAMHVLHRSTLVGANPRFDAAFLAERFGYEPWHYRLWDIQAFAAGVLGMHIVPSMHKIHTILNRLGYDTPEPDHTAAGDVATLRAAFYALHEIREEAA